MILRLPRPDEWLHGVLAFVPGWWGGILILPGDTFATTPAMAAFGRIATEDHWAIALALVSACGYVGLFWRRLRAASMHIVAIALGTISITILISNPIATGAGTYSALMLSAWYLLYWNHKNA